MHSTDTPTVPHEKQRIQGAEKEAMDNKFGGSLEKMLERLRKEVVKQLNKEE